VGPASRRVVCAGQYNFFLLSITLICLVPWTWYSVNQSESVL
jgi:hypothetical protein